MKNSYFATGVEMLSRAIPPINFETFMLYMPVLLDLARGMYESEESKTNRRGYLTLMNAITGEIVFTVPFGEIPEEKKEKYFEFSQEKAHRLFSQVNMHLPNGHTTSFQSRNEELDMWGGAIYLNSQSLSVILSFSGMPELIDEAMMLVVADRLVRLYGLKNVTKIEAVERNPYWKPLWDKFRQHPAISRM